MTVRAALLRFAGLTAVAVLVLTAVTAVLAEHIARDRAFDDAREQARGVADRIAAPLVDADLRAGDQLALAQLDRVMTNRMQDGSLVHAKVWNGSERVLWSDEDELVGQRFGLSADVQRLFGTRGAVTEVSELAEAENASLYGRDSDFLEVYIGAFDADGEPIVFESYLAVDSMREDAETIMWSFMPLVLGALVLLTAVVMPLAVSLTRQVARAHAERASLMRHALLASERERRRLAADLHDGVIQDLAGLGYVLPTATRELRAGGDLDHARAVLHRATDLLHRDVASLRALMTDIYPPDLRGSGLAEAVEQLVRTEAHQAGIAAEVSVPGETPLAPDAGRLAYRIVREAVRNVVKHAGAEEVAVEVSLPGDRVRVRVADDGRGPGEHAGESPEGHLGLRLIRDTLHDFGGSLTVVERPGGGTVVEAEYPATLVPS